MIFTTDKQYFTAINWGKQFKNRLKIKFNYKYYNHEIIQVLNTTKKPLIILVGNRFWL